jgi:hypothetical protein
MFMKDKWVGSVHGYKKVVDWDAVWGTIFAVVLGLVILNWIF